ncbi:hypothetical protein J2Y03_004424 [Neobacillus niacini]|nr:hypothetical protein [Neobacillus niacini]MDR7079366.1 hypothetical protein [Neobacillus niacini]
MISGILVIVVILFGGYVVIQQSTSGIKPRTDWMLKSDVLYYVKSTEQG